MKLEKIKHYSRGDHHPLKLAVIGFVGAFLFVIGGFLLRSWLDIEIEQKVDEAIKKNYSVGLEKQEVNSNLPTEEPVLDSIKQDAPTIKDSFINGSFSDTFSGLGWLAGLSINQDRYTTGLTPFLNIDLKPLKNPPVFPDGALICPQGFCVSESNGNIYAGGEKINLPSFTGTLENLDVFPLKDKWILGITSKSNNLFSGWIYLFDGKSFNSVMPSNKPIFESRYSGRFAFAGISSHWLSVYGSYEGKAWEFSNDGLRDLSHLLNSRVMRGGFTPRILSLNSDWFIANSSGGFPFLKFFSSGSEVVGSLDLTDLIDEKFSEDLRNLKAVELGEKILLELTGPSGVSNWFELSDRGFSYPEKLEITSSNLRINQPQNMARARISEIKIYPENIQPTFFLANSNGTWQSVRVGEWVYFPKDGKELYWRADLSDIKKPFFFDLIKIEYGLNP